ncbi:polysaccharide biosynthesis tyrosine autokinase [bacterium]|nr:polysaccharide biosynthesis tyrosine autokinase [bacterium]
MEELQEQQVTLTDYIRILRRGRWIIVLSFLVVMTVTVYFTFTAQPVYEASALILLKEEGGVKQEIFEVGSLIKRETMINNHVEILKSRTLAEDVINDLMSSEYADSLWILGNRKREKRLDWKHWIAALLKQNIYNDEIPHFDELVKNFREEAISVVPKRDTDMVELKVQAFSPFEAALVANIWMQAYINMDKRYSKAEVTDIREFLEGKQMEMEQKLTASENALKNYKEKEGVVELNSETEQVIKMSADFETMYQEAVTELEANNRRLAVLKSKLNESQKAALSTSLSSPVILELQKQQGKLIADKASYEQQLKGTDYYSPDDPTLRKYEQRLEGLQEKIREEMNKMVSAGATSLNPLEVSEGLVTNVLEIEAENSSLKAKTQELQKVVNKYNRELNSLPEKHLRLAQLQREMEVTNNIYLMLREKYEENRIAEVGHLGSVRSIDRAKPPKKPISPKKKMNLIFGFFVGIGLGVGITFIREYMDNTVKSIEDMEHMGFTVLGSIPFITAESVGKNGKGENGEINRIESRLITHFAPKSPISEAYRSLRTNIQFSQADQKIKTALITSSVPGEGKSTTVANLAITFAQMGARTLLVDADLRRPVLHGIFGCSRNNGLTNVLVGRSTLEEAVHVTRVEGLNLMASGTLPPNPSELINSKMMEKLISKASGLYDIVLFDTPPVIAVTDAAVLATKVDGVVLVTRSGETDRDVIYRSKTQLEKVNAKMLGVLMNGVNVNMMYGSYYQYYQYYYYSGDNKKKKRMKQKAVS